MGTRTDRRQIIFAGEDPAVPGPDASVGEESEPFALASSAVGRRLPWTMPVDGVLYIELIRAEDWRSASWVGR
jgi:hypothetical protein